MASSALAPTFDQRHPAFLNRPPTMRLQAFSTTPDPIGPRRVWKVAMSSAARARMRGARRSRVFRNRPDPDCNPPTQTRTKRKISSNQRKWDAPCSLTASPVIKRSSWK